MSSNCQFYKSTSPGEISIMASALLDGNLVLSDSSSAAEKEWKLSLLK